ncbi:glutathione S-transferase N-terminal domain-containing protein [Marinobacter salicampi]|uniref:glutathione S-transferase N-terminal domain-containing protein n=1 Tax=Marinobacter salicampi TaxID=435907 RepID=UPI0014073C25|nr:glutathione S-transferase N-terminal domain-containing protein [Marinobacter salicampi]
MIDLYTWSTPNGRKASIMLEELAVPYRVTAVDIGKGEQHHSEFRQLSPNGKIPAIVDHEPDDGSGQPRRIFESGNILMYLAEKTGKFLPAGGQGRTEVMGWLFFQMAHLGPMVGQWHWFKNAAPEKSELGIKRYREETLRLLEVMNGRLAEAPYLGGKDYSIADIASYAWARTGSDELAKEDAQAIANLKPLLDWLSRVGERPAVEQGMEIPTPEQKQESAERAAVKGPAGGGSVLP